MHQKIYAGQPSTIVAACLGGFYLLMALASSVPRVESGGWLLGPFPESCGTKVVTPDEFRTANWSGIAKMAAGIASVVGMACVAQLLHLTGIRSELAPRLDIDGELRTSARANLTGALSVLLRCYLALLPSGPSPASAYCKGSASDCWQQASHLLFATARWTCRRVTGLLLASVREILSVDNESYSGPGGVGSNLGAASCGHPTCGRDCNRGRAIGHRRRVSPASQLPNRSYLILEARATLGGTWDLFRYPGIRSDSDMYTMGYEFKPWTDDSTISSGPLILSYLQETAEEYGITERIRYNRRMTSASWSSSERRWTLTVESTGGADGDQPTSETFTCNFLFMCSGYYSYTGGYRPDFEGEETFEGPIIHPQQWPEDLDYTNKRVAIIGSGATAMTLVPALADGAAHVTMVQRSPTFVVARPGSDPVARMLRKVVSDENVARFMRWRAIKMTAAFYKMTRKNPDKAREMLMKRTRKAMPNIDIDTHFTPTYNPWDQRLCLIPDGDLYEALNSGAASVVTDQIDRFTSDGIQMVSGETIEADIIVTATGLQLVTLGEADFFVDGNQVDFSQTWTYKGLAYSDVPNMASVFGYVNASWTLRSDMITKYVCRLLNHMTHAGADVVVPRLRSSDADMTPRPYIDDFPAGYMKRAMPLLPKQGNREPWLNTQSYRRDVEFIAEAEITDNVLVFEQAAALSGKANQ